MTIKTKFFVTLLVCVGLFDISYGQQKKTLLNRALNQDLCLEVNDGGVPKDGVCVTSIGNVSVPSGDLNVSHAGTTDITATSSDSDARLVLDGTKSTDVGVGQILFNNAGDSVAGIEVLREGANDAAEMKLQTQATGGALTTQMTIESIGRVTLEKAIVFDPTSSITVTGTQDNLDVQGKTYVNLGNAATLTIQNILAGTGTAGQLLIFLCRGAGTVNFLNQNSTGGGQQFFMHGGGTQVCAGNGSSVYLFDGSLWRLLSHLP